MIKEANTKPNARTIAADLRAEAARLINVARILEGKIKCR